MAKKLGKMYAPRNIDFDENPYPRPQKEDGSYIYGVMLQCDKCGKYFDWLPNLVKHEKEGC